MTTESDVAYYKRALTRIYRLADRTDILAGDRLLQIKDQAGEGLGRESGDDEVIVQLKATIGELRSRGIDIAAAEQEVGLVKAQLTASEKARREIEAQLAGMDLSTDKAALYVRLEDLGAVLVDAYGNEEAIGLGTRAVAALAKRAARELDDDERLRRGKSALLELLES